MIPVADRRPQRETSGYGAGKATWAPPCWMKEALNGRKAC